MFFVFAGELATSIRTKTDIKFGLYHSMYEWFNPLYLMDKENHYATQRFPNVSKMHYFTLNINRIALHLHFGESTFQIMVQCH